MRSLSEIGGRDLRASYGFGLRYVTLDGLLGYASLGFGADGARLRIGETWAF